MLPTTVWIYSRRIIIIGSTDNNKAEYKSNRKIKYY